MRQELRLEQRLLLTPQLLMNLKLLQMPTLELEQMIEHELETNPALEQVEEPTGLEERPAEAATAEPAIGEPAEPAPELPDAVDGKQDSAGLAEVPAAEVTKLEGAIDSGELAIADFLQDDGYIPPFMEVSARTEGDPLETVSGGGTVSIVETLLPRLSSRVAEADQSIAEAIVNSLDEDGFLFVPEEEIARQVGVPQERVDQVLFVLRRLDGGGIGAKTIREALLLQLEVMGYEPESVEYRIVSEYYDVIARRHYEAIARGLATTENRVREAMLVIAQLEPRPGRKYGGSIPGYVSPDFCVEWQGDNLVFYSTDESVRRLRLAPRYREMLLNPKSFSKEQVEFARRKFQGALMLIKGIESRRRTLNRVMQHIITNQREFFEQGREHMKPLSIKDAGAALGIHPSTISRAVQGKYVETPYGICSMRFFFTTGTDGCARHSVKDKIRRMIEAENKQAPCSDEEIVELLKKEGVAISRRTVAKYRAEMNLPGCAERRQA